MSSGFFSSLPFIRGAAQLPQVSVEQQVVKILTSNADFPESSKPFAIKAEVVSQNPDKSLILKTDYGDVSVRPKGNEKFEPGQSYRLDVPAGKGTRAGREALLSPPETLKNVAPPPTIPVRTTPAQGALGSAPSPQIPDEAILKPTIPPVRGSVPSRETGAVLTEARAASSVSTEAKIPAPIRLDVGALVRLNILPKEALTLLTTQNAAPVIQGQTPPIPAVMALIVPQVFKALQLQSVSFPQPYQGFLLPQPEVPAQAPIITDAPVMRPTTITAHTPLLSQGAGKGGDIPLVQPVQGQVHSEDGNEFAITVRKNAASLSQAPSQSQHLSITQIDGKIVQVSQGVQSQNAMILQGKADALSFRIAAFQANGQPILVPLSALNSAVLQQAFTMNVPVSNLQVGQILTIRPDMLQNATPSQSQNLQIWSALLAELTGGAPLPVASPLHALPLMMPQATAPSQILPSVMFLFAAIRGGGIEHMMPLGKAADLDLKTQRLLKTLETLTKEGAASLGRAVSSSAGEFRAYSFPLHYQDQFVPVSLYVQSRGDNDRDNYGGQGDEKVDATRFLFEFDLTRMGLLQIDGMIREANCDIFVRTGRALSPQMKSAIRETYLHALEKSNLQGDVAFQTRDQNWVEIEAA